MLIPAKRAVIALSAMLMALPAMAQSTYSSSSGAPLDVPYVPTPDSVVKRMLEIVKAGPNDIHYDLGSGDGRIVVAAARDFKVKKATGIDLDPKRIAEAKANAEANKVTDRVTFVQGDLFKFDFKDATILTMYLLPSVNMKLRPKVLDLAPGTRVVSHAFDMEDWEADHTETVGSSTLYHWIVPAKVQGAWQWQAGSEKVRADLQQQFQKVSGTVQVGGATGQIQNGKVTGDVLSFEAQVSRGGKTETVKYEGKVAGDTLTLKDGGVAKRAK